jgi:hypothetical protein
LRHQAIEHRHYVLAAEALPDLDRHRLAAEHIDHGQRAETRPIGELIRYKV